mmetsp:Transcript_11237/g.26173  ORF Transcript_11237/g.26173 Transcript_11237/m.26173 type:complete len:275 (+) Transcript_11237:486-1310(+)
MVHRVDSLLASRLPRELAARTALDTPAFRHTLDAVLRLCPTSAVAQLHHPLDDVQHDLSPSSNPRAAPSLLTLLSASRHGGTSRPSPLSTSLCSVVSSVELAWRRSHEADTARQTAIQRVEAAEARAEVAEAEKREAIQAAKSAEEARGMAVGALGQLRQQTATHVPRSDWSQACEEALELRRRLCDAEVASATATGEACRAVGHHANRLLQPRRRARWRVFRRRWRRRLGRPKRRRHIWQPCDNSWTPSPRRTWSSVELQRQRHPRQQRQRQR